MFGEFVGGLLSAFRSGVAILLIGTVFTVTVTRLYDTDENGVRVRDVYRNKRLVLALAIIFPLSSAVVFGYVQPVLVQLFHDPRVLLTGVGVLLPLLLVRTNAEADNWKVLDGHRDTYAVLGLSLIFMFGPWLGPLIINYIVHQATTIITGVTNYVIGGITAIINQTIQAITAFIMSLPLQQIGLGLVLLVVLVLLFWR